MYIYVYCSVSPTFQLHPNVETFLESAVRASLPLRLINNTVPVRHTGVDLLVLDCPLEESLAGLAGEETVVVSGHLIKWRAVLNRVSAQTAVCRAPYLVSTHRTELLQAILGVRLVAGADDSIVHVA